MIGLVDYNINSSKIIIPNLEVMKVATYYRNEERHFSRLISLGEKNLEGYDKIYFFSNDPNTLIPEQFKQAKNVDFRGLFFTPGKYIPFENQIVDYTLPRTFIYKDYLRQQYDDGTKMKDINHFMDDTYYRMYAGNNKLPVPPIMKNKRIFLYDVDFFYPDWREILNNISNRSPSSIVRLYPVFCHTLNDFFELRSFQKFARTNEIVLDLPLPLDELNVLFRKYELRFLADITINSNVYLPLGGDLKMRGHFREDFIYKMNLLYAFWAKGIPIKLKYVKPRKTIVNPIEELELAAENWANLSTPKKREKALEEKLKKGEVKEQWDEMLRFYPNSFSLVEQSFDGLKEKGYWRI